MNFKLIIVIDKFNKITSVNKQKYINALLQKKTSNSKPVVEMR